MSLDYALKFKPILKEKIWGGEKLVKLLNKESDKKNIGESWEISNIKDNVSIVENGKLKGHTLNDLMVLYRDEFLGKKVFSQFSYEFPLLIKFIDAKEALSVQLHPDNKLAKERHGSLGKTEMWYVIEADESGKMIVGFKEKSNEFEFQKYLNEESLLEILNVDPTKNGDAYFIPSRTIHAIKAGILLVEIEQASDITYRVYDWNREDSESNSRELHTELALNTIDFNIADSYKKEYTKTLNKPSNIVDCEYFTTNFILLNESLNINHEDKDSFVIYICIKGSVSIKSNGGEVAINFGETALLPAAIKKIEITTDDHSELLEVYIK